MITRRRVYLELRDDDVPDASCQLERDGCALLRGAFSSEEVTAIRAEVERVFADFPADARGPRTPEEDDDFRYEMLNRSVLCQQVAGDRRLLDVLEPLLGEDCHVIANTAWRNPPRAENDHGGGGWHIDAGPHIPRPADVPWDDRIPYPVFAIGLHLLLDSCPADAGPTGVLPGSHRSGQAPPFERARDETLRYDEREPVLLTGEPGDVALFVSDAWHRRMPSPGKLGRFFLQIHYGRRDLAQRLRTTREANQLSAEALERAQAGNPRDRRVVGLHRPGFYDG